MPTYIFRDQRIVGMALGKERPNSPYVQRGNVHHIIEYSTLRTALEKISKAQKPLALRAFMPDTTKLTLLHLIHMRVGPLSVIFPDGPEDPLVFDPKQDYHGLSRNAALTTPISGLPRNAAIKSTVGGVFRVPASGNERDMTLEELLDEYDKLRTFGIAPDDRLEVWSNFILSCFAWSPGNIFFGPPPDVRNEPGPTKTELGEQIEKGYLVWKADKSNSYAAFFDNDARYFVEPPEYIDDLAKLYVAVSAVSRATGAGALQALRKIGLCTSNAGVGQAAEFLRADWARIRFNDGEDYNLVLELLQYDEKTHPYPFRKDDFVAIARTKRAAVPKKLLESLAREKQTGGNVLARIRAMNSES